MRDAFGVQDNVRYSGIIEVGGLPTRPEAEERRAHSAGGSDRQPDRRSSTVSTAIARRTATDDRSFALAAASLRQALQDMPEISEVSKNIMIEETKEGLNIEIVDQDGRSMFPEGSKEPYERTRRLIRSSPAR